MFDCLARITYRHRWTVLAVSVVVAALAAFWGSGVFGALSQGGLRNPDSEAARAADIIEQRMGRKAVDVVVLYSSSELTVGDSRFREIVSAELAELPDGKVTAVRTYWSTGSPAYVSQDRHVTYAALELHGDTLVERRQSYATIERELLVDRASADAVTVHRGGIVPLYEEIDERAKHGVKRAELISLPLLLVLLVLIFGSLVAASLPLLIGGMGIITGFALLRTLSHVTDVSVFAINVVTMLGLGLAIDYALFVVSRFREELPRHSSTEDALARTVTTAGRTVAISGVTVAISLAGLTIFPQPILRSIGLGGIAAVLFDMLAALLALPALLAVAGRRVDALRVPWLRRGSRARGKRTESRELVPYGLWERLARSVMRRPVRYAVGVAAVLLALGAPFLGVQWGGVDAEVLPEGAEARVVARQLDREFPGTGGASLDVVVTGDPSQRQLTVYSERLADLPDTSDVRLAGSGEGAAHISVSTSADAASQITRDLVTDIRELAAPAGTEVLVGGQAAVLVDKLQGLADTLPWMLLVIGCVTLVLMFAAFGSLLLPIKAVVMNAVSLAATFGVLVWGFQEGHLAGLLNFTPTDALQPTSLILVLAAAFGLSMDYEVFLLSRIREEWQRTGDNTTAVATGLQRTGGIITSAALLLCVVLGAFATSSVVVVKIIGVGMVVAVLIDATLVRALLVPATMRLLGRANWWLPGPLRRLHARIELREPGDDVEEHEDSGSDESRHERAGERTHSVR